MRVGKGGDMQHLLEALEAALGPAGVVTAPGEVEERSYSPWGPLGTPLAIVRPAETAQVAAVLRIAAAHGVPVSPWGGKTGLVDGAYADGILALSLDRMAAVEAVDRQASTMVVQAGCVLQAACEAAEAAGLFLPLDLGARGSATIGGVISTNAGGNRVLRFGMMRDMVLGLEAVLADGSIISAMKPLMKNNTGYDLKQMFIGSEGTLGVVTRAVLRLRPLPVSQCTALLAVPDFAALARLLRLVEARLAGTLSAFEVMWPAFYELVTTPPAAGRPILPYGHSYYVMVEAMGSDEAEDADRFERVLAAAMDEGLVQDAVVAKSKAESGRIWALRDDVAQMMRHFPIFTFDVSLRIADMEDYVAEVRGGLLARWPAATLVVFGHLGDGNLHLVAGVGDSSARHEVEEIVYSALGARNGSISAEHGIGLQKRLYLKYSRSPAELAMMRLLKAALDPLGILNRGKVLELNA
jgi:FAD/FMN-containing dehydrogenase